MRDLMITVVSSAAIIMASYLNFLRFNEYPFLTPEVLIVAAGILLLTASISLLYQSQKALGRAILEGLLIFFVLDQNTAGILYSTLAGATIIAIVLWRKKSTLPFLGTAAFLTLLISIAGIGSVSQSAPDKMAIKELKMGRPDSEKPPALLHVIFDEHSGIEGFPADNNHSRLMKKDLQEFYQKRNFRLFGRAYSEHLHTVNSIPQILNFGALQNSGPTRMEGGQVKRNAYFSYLQKRGYDIKVLQSDYLDYCSYAKVVDCETYGNASLSMLSQTPISIGQRAQLIVVRFFTLSQNFKNIGYIYLLAGRKLKKWGVNLPSLGLKSEGRVSSLNAFIATDGFRKKLEKAKAGEAFFAHLLLPHYPYVLTSGCNVKPVSNWRLRRSAEALHLKQNAYFEQIKCITHKLDSFILALERSPAKEDFVIIVHGDHGSRITTLDPIVENVGAFNDKDMLAGFSTLFAVRATGVKVGYVNQAAPVSALLKNFSEQGFLKAPAPPLTSGGLVTLDDANWKPTRSYSLPKSWLNAGQVRP